MADDASHRRRPEDIVAVYGLAHFGKSLFWNTSSLLFAFFLTETVGFAPDVMSYVLAGSLAFNGVADYLVGRLLGRWVRKASTAVLAQLAGGGLAAIAFILFAATGIVPAPVRLGYACATILIFRLGYSLFDVPQNAFMAFASSTDEARATLASARYIAAGASILLISLIFAPVLRETDPLRQASHFLAIAVALSVIVCLTSAALAWSVRTHPVGTPVRTAEPPGQAAQAPAGNLFPLILVAIFCLSLTSTAFTKLQAYFTAYALADPFSIGAFMACVAGGKVIAQPLWARLVTYWPLVSVFRWACLAMAGASAMFYFAGRAEPVGSLMSAFAFGASSGGVFMTLWSLLARAASSDPGQTTRRFGAFTFFSKMAQASGLILLGQVLSLFDYTAPSGRSELVLIMSGVPALGAFALLVLFLPWRRAFGPPAAARSGIAAAE